MTHSALALFVSAAMFRDRTATRGNEQGTDEFEIGMIRAGRGLRAADALPSSICYSPAHDDCFNAQ